jgi:integrase
MGLVLKYVQEPNESRNHFRYRRRVPDSLKAHLGKTELVATLGTSRETALKAYHSVHAGFERELAMAKKAAKAKAGSSPESLTDRERYDLLIERLKELGIDDPFAKAADELEADHRELMADALAAKYEEDPETGHPLITSPADAFLVRALMTKAPAKPAPTFEDAVKLYRKERLKGSDLEVKKNGQRVDRVVKRLKQALGGFPAINALSRDDARKVRDQMLSDGISPASAKRELNIVKAIVNHAIKEYELACNNPFGKLEIPGLDEEDESQKRDPFPDDLLDKTRASVLLHCNDELRLIWRLLEGTGARLAEVTGLRVEDLTVGGPTPNMRVTWHEGRRVKTKASKRYIPLVGDALAAAKQAIAAAEGRAMLFARYGTPNGPTNASQTLMRRVSEAVGDNPRLVVHSLRHNMKDRLILASTPELDQNLILGHSLGGVGNRVYGGDAAKLKATTAAMKKAFGLPA